MSKKFTTIATTVAMLMSTSAMAEGTIATLGNEGSVTLSGMVESVQDNNKFTLKDANGDTIDVNSKSGFNVNKGERVTVSGVLDAEMLGMGKEINSASVTRTSANANANMNNNISAQQRAKMEMDYPNTKANTEKGVATEVGTQANAGVLGTNVGVGVHTKANTTANAESAISNLPDQGDVTIRGTVASVSNDKEKFTLRDMAGNTIDVNSKTAMNVKVGDNVTVKGRMEDEIAGMGEEIQAYSVHQASLR